MPSRPDRPGKHRAAHKAPSAFSRATARVTSRARKPPHPEPHRPTPNRTHPTLRRHGATAVALGGVVMAATAVSGSALSSQAGSGDVATKDIAANVADEASQAAKTKTGTERTHALPRASRDSIRAQIAELRPKAESSELGGGGVSDADEIIPDDPREIAMMMLDDFGWDESQFGCLDELWSGESNWSVTADNPRSSAYGIPQALPGSKMASAGPDWETNPVTQITWGLGYIDTVYGDPCSANSFKQANNWY